VKLHEPGIYIGMPADEYHADPALGSSNIKDLIKSPRKYWLRSPYNPDRDRYVDPETDSTVMGTALHCRLLDGDIKFVKSYARRPDDLAGATPADKAKVTKAFNASLEGTGKIALKADEWQLIEDTHSVITAHPDLAQVFKDALYEVSIFWHDRRTGTRCKARLDILKPRGIGDLKTIANERDNRLEKACKFHIKSYRYDIQAEHYLEARRQVPQFVENGDVFYHIENVHPMRSSGYVDQLSAVAREGRFAFQLVFVSKALPEVWSCVLSPGNPMLATARDHIDTALEEFERLRNAPLLSTGHAWPETWSLQELAIEDMPGGTFGWD